MKQYVIKKFEGIWENIEKGLICEYPWGGDYRPEAYFKAVHTNDEIIIRLYCKESSPKAVYSNYMDPVYEDSCIEFFACYSKGGYINCEVNSKGASLVAYGPDRYERTPLKDVCGELPVITASRDGEFWYAEIKMPYKIIEKIYGKTEISSGYEFFGNAYKCGDGCEVIHYGMWNPAECENPDFHRPEYFGKFIIE